MAHAVVSWVVHGIELGQGVVVTRAPRGQAVGLSLEAASILTTWSRSFDPKLSVRGFKPFVLVLVAKARSFWFPSLVAHIQPTLDSTS